MRRKNGVPHFKQFDGAVFDKFCQNYWSQDHQNLPSFSHQYYLQILFYKNFCISKKKFFVFLYTLLQPSVYKEGKVEQWVRRRTANLRFRVRVRLTTVFFFSFFPHISAFAGHRSFFCPKNLRIFLKTHYINYRYDRRFAEDLRPPHFRQMNLIQVSLGNIKHMEPFSLEPSQNYFTEMTCLGGMEGEFPPNHPFLIQ